MAKRLSRKKAKNFYAAFPAGISETPEMNNIFQYLFPTLEMMNILLLVTVIQQL